MSPVPAGNKVSFQVKKDVFDQDNYVYIAMKAFDNVNLPSPISLVSKLQTDIISPGKVTNLKINPLVDTVQLSFTAPGDDLNKGKGRCSIFLLFYMDLPQSLLFT